MRSDQIFSLSVFLIVVGAILVGSSQVKIPAEPPADILDQKTTRSHQEAISKQDDAHTYYAVERVVDGDTIIIQGFSDSVRLIGINTPELADPRSDVRCFAQIAAKRLEDLIGEREVALEADIQDRDRYHRLLRYVYLPDGTFVNLIMIKEGYGTIMTIPPNIRYAPLFLAAQQEARQRQRGVWSSVCPT